MISTLPSTVIKHTATRRPDLPPCKTCKGDIFWESLAGIFTCSTCHPVVIVQPEKRGRYHE